MAHSESRMSKAKACITFLHLHVCQTDNIEQSKRARNMHGINGSRKNYSMA